MTDAKPDWENFARAVLADWPTGDLDGSFLFELSLQYGMIQEVPGGFNSDRHFDDDGICPEEGDPWYEYTFRGEAGPGLCFINAMHKRIKELEAKVAKAVDAFEIICSQGVGDESIYTARAALAKIKGDKHDGMV